MYRDWGASDWGNKWVVVRKCIGQIWWSGPGELGVSMGSGMCIAGDHSRHGTEYLMFSLQHVYTITSSSDLHSTRDMDSDGHLKQSQTSEDYREQGENRGGDPSRC